MIAEPRIDRTDPTSARDLADVVRRIGRVLHTVPSEHWWLVLSRVIADFQREGAR